MISTPHVVTATPRRRRGARRVLISTAQRQAALCRRLFLAVMAAPVPIRVLLSAGIMLAVWLAVNWTYHAIRKPAELLFPVSGALAKAPVETWRQYGALFKKHSTAAVPPELLAALAQVEAGGNPVARTYWRARPAWNPLDVYRPASSAVGMFQMTDATFREAKRYCVHNHVVVRDGPWHDMNSCWFNSLYTRVLPSHAIELAAVHLDRGLADVMGRRRMAATVQQNQNLAAVIHLCGASTGQVYAERGFRLTAHQRCGDHDVARYLTRVNNMKRQFARLAADGKLPPVIKGR